MKEKSQFWQKTWKLWTAHMAWTEPDEKGAQWLGNLAKYINLLGFFFLCPNMLPLCHVCFVFPKSQDKHQSPKATPNALYLTASLLLLDSQVLGHLGAPHRSCWQMEFSPCCCCCLQSWAASPGMTFWWVSEPCRLTGCQRSSLICVTLGWLGCCWALAHQIYHWVSAALLPDYTGFLCLSSKQTHTMVLPMTTRVDMAN